MQRKRGGEIGGKRGGEIGGKRGAEIGGKRGGEREECRAESVADPQGLLSLF